MLLTLSHISSSTLPNSGLNLVLYTFVNHSAFSSTIGKTVGKEEQKPTSQPDEQVYQCSVLRRPKSLA
jgi:hypothetical protein